MVFQVEHALLSLDSSLAQDLFQISSKLLGAVMTTKIRTEELQLKHMGD